MGIGHLLDHTVTVWRATQSLDAGGLRSVDKVWTSTGRTGIPAGIQVRGESRGDSGGGERTSGNYLGFMLAGANVLEGDIIQVTAGPGSWGFLLVDGASSPRGHHTEFELIDTTESPV